MLRTDDFENLKESLRRKLTEVIGGRGVLHDRCYSLTSADEITFIMEPATEDLLKIDEEIRRRLWGVRTACRMIQSYDSFAPELHGRVCVIITFNIQYATKSSKDNKMLVVCLFLLSLFLFLLLRHIHEYDFNYFKYFVHPKQ